MHFDKILSKHSQGGSGKAGGGVRHPHRPHPQPREDPSGLAMVQRDGAVLPFGAASWHRPICPLHSRAGPKGQRLFLACPPGWGKRPKR